MPDTVDPILFYTGNFTARELVEKTLLESDYHLMSTNSLQDMPDFKALSYFHMIIFCPGNDLDAELVFLAELKHYHPGPSLPLLLFDPHSILENREELLQLDFQDYRSHEVNKSALRFAVKRLLTSRKEFLEQEDELKRLMLEKDKKSHLLEEVSLKAQESDRLKTAFLNNISHELRTPMNGILGFLEYLEDPQLEGALKSQFIKNIRESSERLLNTLQDLIEISEIEAGDLKMKFETVNLKHLGEFVYKHYLPRASAKGLRLNYHFNVPEERNMIWSDANKLKGILIHLLNNSIKFTNKGQIDIRFEMIEDRLEIIVKDSGIGMHEEDIERIYRHFVQIEEHLTRKYDGLGLGLTICEAYSQCLNGKLQIESKVDNGTTVALQVPFISGKMALTPKKPIRTDMDFHFSKAKVLLVDDDPINLQLLEKFLKDSVEDLQTQRAKNGVEAVEFYRQDPSFDLILMDLKMPLMNGFEATRQIRGLNEQVPIIAQTAYAMHQDKRKALDEGCNDFLSKPLNKKSFNESIAKFLKPLANA